jgi:hypothetical protein
MRCRNSWLALALTACDGGFGIGTEPGFFGDSAGGVGSDSDFDPCLQATRGAWPADEPVGPGATPEILLAPGVSVRTSTWWTDDQVTIEHSRQEAGAVLRLVPSSPLERNIDTTWTVSFDDNPDMALLCRYSLEGHLQTQAGGLPASNAQTEGRSWWLPLDERADSSGVLLGRLISRTGPTAGRALALAVHGQQIWIGTVLRDPHLPADPCDSTDTADVFAASGSLVASADRVLLDDPVNPLVLRDLQLTGSAIDEGDRLQGVHLLASLDLSGVEPATRSTFCALADEIGRPCAPCAEDEPDSACIAIDARGLNGTALDTSLAQVTGESVCPR